jgi:hypothetical protein
MILVHTFKPDYQISVDWLMSFFNICLVNFFYAHKNIKIKYLTSLIIIFIFKEIDCILYFQY